MNQWPLRLCSQSSIVPLLLLFTKKVFSQPTYVHVVHGFVLCKYVGTMHEENGIFTDLHPLLVRVTAFVIRAVMIRVESAGEDLGLLIGDQILFGIGYAGLMYTPPIPLYWICMFFQPHLLYVQSAYRCSERNGRSNQIISKDEHHIFRTLRNRHLFRIVMAAAVALGIVASTSVSSDGTAGS
jgi:hypothetical protein